MARVYLMRLQEGVLEVKQTLDMDAVLDMKWSCTRVQTPLLAVADAKGAVSVYALDRDECMLELKAPSFIF